MHCGIFCHDVTKKSLTFLRVSYNNSFRRLFGLPYYCSASEMFVPCDILTQTEITRKITWPWGFIEKLIDDVMRYISLCFGAQFKTVAAFLQNILLGNS